MADPKQGAPVAPTANVVRMKEPEPHPLDVRPPPAPTKRIEAERQERRRRRDTDVEFFDRHGVDKSLLDPNFEYRWFNDRPGRIHNMTVNDDWDFVEDPRLPVNPGDMHGARVRQVAEANKDGSALYRYLLRKPKDFYREDYAKKQQRTDEQMGALKRGVVKGADGQPVMDQSKTYVPEGGISITHEQAKVSSYKP
jgi:hypothetical protein